jgi:hypothetical protein
MGVLHDEVLSWNSGIEKVDRYAAYLISGYVRSKQFDKQIVHGLSKLMISIVDHYFLESTLYLRMERLLH